MSRIAMLIGSALALGVVVAAAASGESNGGGNDPPPPGDDKRQRPKQGPPPDQVAVGQPSDPAIAAWLAELDAYLSREVPRVGWTARELTTMPKAPGAPVAIPPRSLWANMVPTLRLLVELRRRMGDEPLSLRAYRPPDYDRAVAGGGTSLHTYFAAIDIRHPDRRRLARTAARLVLDRPDESIGFGVYGAGPSGSPSNIHLDTGWRRRTWEHARAWLDNAKAGNA